MEEIFERHAKDSRLVGIGTGRTMEAFSKCLAPDKIYLATSTQTELFLSGLPMASAACGHSIDVYFDSADHYTADGDLIKGGGGAMTQEKLFVDMARKTVIIVQREKRLGNFSGVFVPVEIIRPSYGYVSEKLKNSRLAFSLRKVDGKTPFVTDLGNLIVDVEYNEAFLETCTQITGVIEHGYFSKRKNIVIEVI